MLVKAQKSHEERSGLYGGCSNGVPPIHFFQAGHRIQFSIVRSYSFGSGKIVRGRAVCIHNFCIKYREGNIILKC
jgi:hypothetical protein